MRSWTRWAAGAAAGLAFCIMTFTPRPAHAVYQCGDQKDDCQCGVDDPYPCCDNGGNCTWWAWEAACCNWAVGLPGWGNANQWVGHANLDPNYDVLPNPVVGSIACRVSGTYGHVAWVTAVHGSTIDVTEENCCSTCNYGMRTHTYDASYFDGGFIVRASQCECTPGQTQPDACGNCGRRERTCGADCKWQGWSACGSEGECAKGTTEEQPCGDCGKHTRTCDDACHWGDFGACAGPDPNDACDTGQPGVCSAGTRKCVDGNLQCLASSTASAETCDGLDNDCDGQTDEDGVCGAGDGGVPPTDGGKDGSMADGSIADGTDGSVSDGPGASDAHHSVPADPAKSGVDESANCACGLPGSPRSLAGMWGGLALAMIGWSTSLARRARRRGGS